MYCIYIKKNDKFFTWSSSRSSQILASQFRSDWEWSDRRGWCQCREPGRPGMKKLNYPKTQLIHQWQKLFVKIISKFYFWSIEVHFCMPEVRYFGNFQMSDISLLDRIPYSTSFQSISNQDVPADALEDAAAPEGKEADEGPKVGCVDVLHVSHRHLFSLTCACYRHRNCCVWVRHVACTPL